MKNIQTYEEFLNEAIEIVSMTDAGFSNRNRTKYVNKFSDIESILTDPETWTDDISFKDKLGNAISALREYTEDGSEYIL